MFLATSRRNDHPNWDICHMGAKVCVSPRRRSMPQTFWPNAARLSSPHHLCWIALPLKISLSGEKCESSVFSNLLIHLVKQSAVNKDGRPLRSSSWTFALPSLNILHHLLTIPQLSIFSINVTNLPINFSRANVFGIQKFDHWPYLTTGGIFDFLTLFKTKWRTYK
jgi:hypothetical protein